MVIRFLAVSKSFPDQTEPAIRNLELSVESGEIIGLVGLNGAGKTTLLRIGAGIIRPTKGSVDVDGLDLFQDKQRASCAIGWVSENPNFEPEASVETVLRYLASFYPADRVAGFRVNEVLDAVGLEIPPRSRIHTLSQGMRMRFALATATIGNPAHYLLDEVLNGIDPEGVRRFRDWMFGRRSEGCGILLSSHTLSELEVIADRYAVMHRGRLLRLLRREDLPRVAAPTIRIRFARLAPGSLTWLEGLGSAEQRGTDVLVATPSLSMTEIGRELVARGCILESIRTESPALEALLFESVQGAA